jgi:TonB family protein
MNRRILLAMALPLLAAAASLPKTEQGRVTGRVLDGTGAPLPDVQVYVTGEGIGTLSRSTGTFVIPTVVPGAYELRAERIGFSTRTESIIVEEGGTVEVTFQLAATAVGMDEIVSNGTAGVGAQGYAPLDPSSRVGLPDGPVPAFTPMTVKPELRNLAEVRQAMVAAYPAEMRSAGQRGTVVLRLYLSATGEVQTQQVSTVQPAGLPYEVALIQAARAAASVARFSPAFNYDQRVAVWVQIPMTFRP